MKLYQYPKCSTCRKAIRFLEAAGIDYISVDISERPPTAEELRRMLEFQAGRVRKLFNTSGMQYRNLKLKDRMEDLSADEAVGLLSGNGMLVKRPFLLAEKAGLLGFREDEWQQVLKGA